MLISKMHILCVLMLIIVPVSVHAKAAGCVEGNCDTGSGVYHYEGQLFGQQYDGQWLAGERIGTRATGSLAKGRAMASIIMPRVSDTMESSKTIGSRARAPTTSAMVVVTTVHGQTTSQMVVASSAIPTAVATQVTSHGAQAG
jgi:hypothetical protein